MAGVGKTVSCQLLHTVGVSADISAARLIYARANSARHMPVESLIAPMPFPAGEPLNHYQTLHET